MDKASLPLRLCPYVCVWFFKRQMRGWWANGTEPHILPLARSLFHLSSFHSLPLFHRLLISHLSGRKHPVWQLSPATCLPALHPHTSAHLHRHAGLLALIVCLIHKPGLVANPLVLGEVTGIVWCNAGGIWECGLYDRRRGKEWSGIKR